MLDMDRWAVVDVETTGLRPSNDRVIEIGVLLVQDNQVIDRFQTLVNPKRQISPFIQYYTGIDPQTLSQAPTFDQLSDFLSDYLADYPLMAHNAEFDYGFLQQEFARCQIEWQQARLCTVKLSRRLFPGQRHNLDAIIRRWQLEIDHRHRALADAEAVWQYWQKLRQQLPDSKLVDLCHSLLRLE